MLVAAILVALYSASIESNSAAEPSWCTDLRDELEDATGTCVLNDCGKYKTPGTSITCRFNLFAIDYPNTYPVVVTYFLDICNEPLQIR
jgi:hypothetical protein